MEAYLKSSGSCLSNVEFPKSINLRTNVTSFGRSKTQCDICFNSEPKVVSRLHSSIVKKDNDWYIRDENSMNGTFVNEKRIERHELYKLKENDIISFGPKWSTGGKLKYTFNIKPCEEGDTDCEEEEEEMNKCEGMFVDEGISQETQPDMSSLSLV